MARNISEKGSTTSVYERSEKKFMRGVIRHLGTEWILLRVEALQGMMAEVNKAFGTGARVVWYLAGKGAGKSMADLIRKRVKSDNIEEVGRKVAKIYERCGWGRVQLVMLRQKTGEFLIRVHNNAFARGTRSQTTSCYYLRGLLEGIAEQLTGKHAKTEETKCMSRGDPYCEFVLVLD